MAPKSKDKALLDSLSEERNARQAKFIEAEKARISSGGGLDPSQEMDNSATNDLYNKFSEREAMFRPTDSLKERSFGPDITNEVVARSLATSRAAQDARQARLEMMFPQVGPGELYSGPGSYGLKSAISPRLPYRRQPVEAASSRLPPGSQVQNIPTQVHEALTDAEQAQLDYLLAKAKGMK